MTAGQNASMQSARFAAGSPCSPQRTTVSKNGQTQHTSWPKSMKSAANPPFTPLQITLTASWECSDSR